jgi:hypothetical protein
MDSDPKAGHQSQDEQQPEEAVALNYLDKVHTSVTRQWDAMTRAITVQTVISLIALAICIGAVTPRERFSFFGLGLTASITTVLVGSAFLIATFQAMSLGSMVRAGKTANILIQTYESLGYEDATMARATEEDPFGATAPIYTLLNNWLSSEPRGLITRTYVDVIGFGIGFGLLFALPIVAELAALVKVASLMGWTENLLWAVLVMPIVVSVACVIWSVEMAGDLQRQNDTSPTSGE